MLALLWLWGDSAALAYQGMAKRLGASLCSGIGGYASTAQVDHIHFAYRRLGATAMPSRAWRPAVLECGRIVAFHGYLDNAAAIALELGVGQDDIARIYGLAVERWGDEAERRVIGEYCAVIADPQNSQLRLSRSPIRAPPLCYFHDTDRAAVASVPRALFAAGVEQRLNEARLADSALLNFSDAESTWFDDIARVPLGHLVEIRRGHSRVIRKPYDMLAIPAVKMNSDAEYIARAGELLDEGVRACLAGFATPGATLSGGLDSPQVAVRALAALPPEQPLPTFTFHPEDTYDGRVSPGYYGDERPFVEAFAAMHARLEPHFTANEGYEHDHRWTDFFHLMGGAPSGLCNMYVFHGLLRGAVQRGCDVLLVSDWGNSTFSDKGNSGYVEYLLKGRWRQLWLGLSRYPDQRSILSRFLTHSILPLLPDRLWRLVRRMVFPRSALRRDLLQPLSNQYRAASGAEQRLKDSGLLPDRHQPRSRRHFRELVFQNDDVESAETYQAFEQMYGVALRDPTAYRPFVEFCLGLPAEMFLRDGIQRWLAREMAKGIMPENQRNNDLYGRWDADWHVRIGRRREGILADLDRLERDERFASMFDFPRLRTALEEWPEQTETDPQKYFTAELAVPRALLAARFINYVEGRNI